MLRNLSVRSKVALAVIGGVILLSAAIYFFSSNLLLGSYVAIERAGMEKDLERAVDAIGEFTDQQMIKLADWAAWDDAYFYSRDRDPAWPPTSIYPSSMANLDNNLAMFTDTTGDIFFIMVTDTKREEEIDSTGIASYFRANAGLVTHTELGSETRGLVMLPAGPLIVVSRPVTDSNEQGPLYGSLTFGRLLNEEKIAELGEVTHLSLSAYRYDDPALPAEVARAKSRMEFGEERVVEAESADRLSGFALLRDVHGTPALIIRVDAPRPIFAQGNQTFLAFMGIGALALLLFGAVLLFLIERAAIARLVRLTKEVEEINENRDLSERIEGGAPDEIGKLAEKMNQMLGWLSAAKEAESSSRREIVNLLDELKKGKEQAEEMRRLLNPGQQ